MGQIKNIKLHIVTDIKVMAAEAEARPRSRGRGRGHINRVQDSLRIPGASNKHAATPSAAISKIITQMNGLSEVEISKIIVPLVEGMITSTEEMEEFVAVLGDHAISDPEFATTAGLDIVELLFKGGQFSVRHF